MVRLTLMTSRRDRLASPPLHVLVVEDDPSERHAIAQTLRDAAAIVFEAADGFDALRILEQHPIDIALIDLIMPLLDGEQLIRRLRRRQRVPVIVVSAKQGEGDRVRALDLGADDFITKPFFAEELLARVRAVLRRSAATHRPNTVSVGDLTLDTASRSASRHGVRVALTEQEFLVLRLLIERQGTVVPRDAVDRVIHPGEPPEVSNVVDVVILRLRKKLGRDLIVTRRGQGFMIDA